MTIRAPVVLEEASVADITFATAPTFRLSRTGTGQVWVQSIDSSGRLTWAYRTTEAGTATELFTLDDAGNVGIGTTTPAQALSVVGNVSASGIITASNLKIDGAHVDFTDLPTADPSVAGRLWNSASYLRISAG